MSNKVKPLCVKILAGNNHNKPVVEMSPPALLLPVADHLDCSKCRERSVLKLYVDGIEVVESPSHLKKITASDNFAPDANDDTEEV